MGKPNPKHFRSLDLQVRAYGLFTQRSQDAKKTEHGESLKLFLALREILESSG